MIAARFYQNPGCLAAYLGNILDDSALISSWNWPLLGLVLGCYHITRRCFLTPGGAGHEESTAVKIFPLPRCGTLNVGNCDQPVVFRYPWTNGQTFTVRMWVLTSCNCEKNLSLTVFWGQHVSPNFAKNQGKYGSWWIITWKIIGYSLETTPNLENLQKPWTTPYQTH